MADGNTVINLKRDKDQPQKLIYIEEEEGEKRDLGRQIQTWKIHTNLREYIGTVVMLSVCCGISFLLVQYPKLSSTVLQ